MKMNNVRALLTVSALSSLSLWIDFFLIFLVPIYLWHASPSEIAVLAFSLGAASLFVGPIAGIILDRIHIRVSFLSGMSLRILTTLGFFLAPSFEWFVIIAVLKGLANMLYFPALAISVKQLVSADCRTDFFSYSSLLDQLTKVSTPLLAGVLTILLPVQSIFLVSVALLLAAIPFLKLIWPSLQPALPNAVLTIRSVFLDLISGVKIFRSLDVQLKIGFFYSLSTSLALASYDPHLASLITSLQFPAIVFSLIVSSTAAGAVCAAIAIKFKIINFNEVKLRTLGLVFLVLGSCLHVLFYISLLLSTLLILWSLGF